MIQAFVRNLGTSRFDAKGAIQVENIHENLSTDAKHWGGRSRSSDEASVVEVEQRGSIVPVLLNQPTENQEELNA